MEFDSAICNTGLGLGIIQEEQPETGSHHHHQEQEKKKKKLCLRYDHFLPSLTLGFSSEDTTLELSDTKTDRVMSSPFSDTVTVSVKKEVTRENYGNNIDEGEEELERISNSRGSDEDEDAGGNTTPRKKLRLTKEQSAVLEESFKEHSTLNPVCNLLNQFQYIIVN